MMAGVKEKTQKRVWIDSQTEEEILRGISEAKDISEYDNLSESAYLRAKEDYLMGINFSRLLSLKYGNAVSSYLGTRYQAISVGRVMTCVLGMVVRREREIRSFVKTPFYRVVASLETEDGVGKFDGEWRAVKGSRYFESPKLYKENGFKEKKDAEELVGILSMESPCQAVIEKIERKKENKIRRFYLTLQNFKMSVPDCLKSVRMKRLKSCRNCMRKNWSLIREQMPVCCLQQLQKKFIKIFEDFKVIPRLENLQQKF